MTHRALPLATVLLLFGVAAMSACGSSAPNVGKFHTTGISQTQTIVPPPPRPRSPSARALFISKADRICSSSRRKLNPLQQTVNSNVAAIKKGNSAATRNAMAASLDPVIALASSTLKKLQDLKQPPRDKIKLAVYFGLVESQIQLFQQLQGSLRKNDFRAAATIGRQIQQDKRKAQRLAHSYGFKVCGSGAADLSAAGRR